MSNFYNPNSSSFFVPGSKAPFRLSRTKIDLFLDCPRCFYLDRRLGVARPPGLPFSLNNAVDLLLKKEFDIHRAAGTQHPLMKAYGLDLVPFQHEKMDEWRDARRRGIRYLHTKTNLIVGGGIDDIWVDKNNEISIVDYKATAKSGEITLDEEWKDSYKRQMEVYQWLFRKNGFKVNDTGYFVYCNGDFDKEAFDGKLEFDVKILPYKGDDSWVEKTIIDAHKCLLQDAIPQMSEDCDYCRYREAVKKFDR